MANNETEFGASKVKLFFNGWRMEKGAQALKLFPQGMGVKEFKGQERGRIWGPLGKEWRYIPRCHWGLPSLSCSFIFFECCLECLVTQLCLALFHAMDYNLPGFSVHGIF